LGNPNSGGFKRDIQAQAYLDGIKEGINSQYYTMVAAEENFHVEGQMLEPEHRLWKTVYVLKNITDIVIGNDPQNPISYPNVGAAEEAFWEAVYDETLRSHEEVVTREFNCPIQDEAKNHAGATHLIKMECTYKNCEGYY